MYPLASTCSKLTKIPEQCQWRSCVFFIFNLVLLLLTLSSYMLAREGKLFWDWRPVFFCLFFYEFLFKNTCRFFYCRASIKIINFNQKIGFTFRHKLNIYKYILAWNVLDIIQKWCNRKTCCNGNGTGNCFFKLRYNLKAKFCRLFFRRAYGEFGHINVFPGKWQKIRDKSWTVPVDNYCQVSNRRYY